MLILRTATIFVCAGGRGRVAAVWQRASTAPPESCTASRPPLLPLVLHRAPTLVEEDIELVVKPLVAVPLVAVCAARQAMATLAERGVARALADHRVRQRRRVVRRGDGLRVLAGPAWSEAAARVRMLESKGASVALLWT